MTTTTVDYLDQDPDLRGQKYCCLSFLSPEDVIVKKDVFFFNKFIGAFATDVQSLFDGLVENNKEDKKIVDMVTALKQRYDYVFDATALGDEYEFYKQIKSEQIEKEYLEQNNFQTTIRGIKVRGSFDTMPEAQKRAEAIRKFDKDFNVYVAQVGCWCPWSPNPEDIEDNVYAETQMNTMMQKYKENQKDKNEHFHMRRENMMSKIDLLKDPIIDATIVGEDVVTAESVSSNIVIEPIVSSEVSS
jgi:hypothetical protein